VWLADLGIDLTPEANEPQTDGAPRKPATASVN
jgi:hypothetical protein